MPAIPHPTSILSPGRSRTWLAATAAVACLLLSGCGTGSPRDPATKPTVAGTVPPVPGHHARANTPATHPLSSSGLAYAKCMRAHGVSDFPDPSPGPGSNFAVTAAMTSSPAFRSAQSRCQNLLGGGGAAFQAAPSRKTMAKLLKIATCMRAHGIHQFPDPLYNRPAHFAPGEYQEITDFDGATLLFPVSMDLQAPAYRQALTACGAPPLGLAH